MHRALSLFALLAAAMAAGCAEAPAPPEPARAEPAPAEPAPAEPAADRTAATPVDDTLPPAMGQDLPTFTTAASSADVASTGPEAPILRAVRVGEHDGFDRIVFEFDSDGLPQWHVSYIQAPVIHCGSGDEVEVAGAAWLQVRFSGANAHTESGEGTSGPARRAPALPSLRELVRTCDFEAEVTWIAGVAAERAYRPRVLEAPARLVIDIAH